MSFYTAQLDINGLVKAVTQTPTELIGSNMIQIQSMDLNLLGKKFENGFFVESEQQVEQSEQSQKESAYSAWVANGFDTGLGYKLRVAEGDQVAFSKLMSSLMLKNPSDSFEVKIEAMDGSIKTLTYAQFKTLMIAYGDYCYASWKAGKGIQ